MNKRFFLFLIFLNSMLLSCAAAAFSEAELVQILQRPQNVQGDFIQQRFLKSLTTPITTSGRFTLVKKSGLLWQMQKPFAVDLKVTPEGIGQWNGSNWISGQNFGQSEQIALFLGLLGGDISALSAQFDTVLSGSAEKWQLTLMPKTLIMKQIFQNIRLQGSVLVNEIELTETQGDRTRIRFEKLTTNQTLTPFARQALEN